MTDDLGQVGGSGSCLIHQRLSVRNIVVKLRINPRPICPRPLVQIMVVDCRDVPLPQAQLSAWIGASIPGAQDPSCIFASGWLVWTGGLAVPGACALGERLSMPQCERSTYGPPLYTPNPYLRLKASRQTPSPWIPPGGEGNSHLRERMVLSNNKCFHSAPPLHRRDESINIIVHMSKALWGVGWDRLCGQYRINVPIGRYRVVCVYQSVSHAG